MAELLYDSKNSYFIIEDNPEFISRFLERFDRCFCRDDTLRQVADATFPGKEPRFLPR